MRNISSLLGAVALMSMSYGNPSLGNYGNYEKPRSKGAVARRKKDKIAKKSRQQNRNK